jgi:hypothetical protein
MTRSTTAPVRPFNIPATPDPPQQKPPKPLTTQQPQLTTLALPAGFVDEHPGGEEVLLDVGGQDSTEAFEDVGHSDEAREILEGLLVGNLKRGVRVRNPQSPLFAHGRHIVPLAGVAAT